MLVSLLGILTLFVAMMCQIGRPVLYLLAVDGEAGVRKMLRDELELFFDKGFYYLVKQYTRPLHNKMHTAVQNLSPRQKAKYISLDELELAMALSGCASLRDITRAHVITDGDRIRRARL
jgi:hypothetical protein